MFPDSQSGDLLGDYYNLATGQMTSAQRAAMEAMYAPQVSYMPSYDYSSSFGGTGGDLTAYLKELYAQQMAAELASLNASYQTSEAELAAQDDLIRDLHNQARNQAAAQNELERMRMNEYYLMQGLNTGAAGQLALAQSAAYQGNLAGIGSQEAQALADNALALAQLRIQYETAIQQAQAQGNMQLANALYNEMVRQENVALQQQAMAQEQARWEAQFAYQQQQDALAQQNYLNELYAAQMAPSEPLLTYSQMMDALAGGLVTPSVTQAYEYYMGTPYNGSVQTTLNKSKSSGSSGGGSKSNMTLTTAKAMASAGQFTDDVISTLKSAGFNDGYLASEYGYSPSGSGMNESNFNAAMTTISAMINQGNTAQAEASIGQIWERLSDTQKGQVQKMVGAYGGSVSA